MLIDPKSIIRTLGALLFLMGIALIFPALVGWLYGEPTWTAFGWSAVISAVVGAVSWLVFYREDHELSIREGFAVVALSWVVLSAFGALPFLWTGALESYTDAFFETMSGFTTTGATVLGGEGNPAIEAVPRSILFWRSLTHWLGGMGIIVLTLAILPLLGVGGMQLYRAEVPGPSADKLTPRVQETAKRLWLIYVGFTLLEAVLLLPAMGWFDAINHAFATMATGGFSTKNASVGQFDSAYIDVVIILFMYLAGVNFALHFRMLRGERITVWKDTELRVYTAIVLLSSALIFFALWSPAASALGQHGLGYDHAAEALRHATFQAVAIITTTGFGTADYVHWSPLAIGIIFALFFVGGMAGSTGGGLKVVRQILLFKNSFKEIRQLLHPHGVLPIRLNGRVVSAEVMRNVLSFVVLYFGLIGMGTLALAAMGIDLLTSLSAAFSAVGNVGPGFGLVGPAETYAPLPGAAKWLLTFLMMAGRLEIFTVLLFFSPDFWRR